MANFFTEDIRSIVKLVGGTPTQLTLDATVMPAAAAVAAIAALTHITRLLPHSFGKPHPRCHTFVALQLDPLRLSLAKDILHANICMYIYVYFY